MFRLRTEYAYCRETGVPVYSLLQHLSTLLGILALAVSYLKWLKTLPHVVVVERRENDGWRYLLFVSTAMSSLVTVTPFVYRLSFTANGFFAMQSFLFRLALSATTMFVLLMTIAAYLIGRARDAGSSL
ncbi:DUF4184 family protein [Undibacterium sp. TJN19]|uniref:DUF4184 family protein n=1 Tax=Undibacterium sp. TJN19 TaxID=3413055 RepID=UPI003BF413A0